MRNHLSLALFLAVSLQRIFDVTDNRAMHQIWISNIFMQLCRWFFYQSIVAFAVGLSFPCYRRFTHPLIKERHAKSSQKKCSVMEIQKTLNWNLKCWNIPAAIVRGDVQWESAGNSLFFMMNETKNCEKFIKLCLQSVRIKTSPSHRTDTIKIINLLHCTGKKQKKSFIAAR